jgi:hypothetical protein
MRCSQATVESARRQSQHTSKRPLLLRRRLAFVLVRLASRPLIHSDLFCLIGIESDMPGLLAQAHERLTARDASRRLAAGESPFLLV